MMYIDTHIHLTHHFFDGNFSYVGIDDGRFVQKTDGTRDALVGQLKAADIGILIEPGIDRASNEKLLRLSSEYKNSILPAVGMHPKALVEASWKDRKIIEKLAKKRNVIAIGELGLDYHLPRGKQYRLRQIRWLVWQIRLANTLELPGIYHIRDADRDAIRIFRLFRRHLHGGVCHCFSGDTRLAKIYTEELGLMLGIGGLLLQGTPVSKQLEDVVRIIPLDKLVIETDGPYVRPARPSDISKKQWERTCNTSLIIPEIAKRIAALKDIPVCEVERVTTENAIKLFHLTDWLQDPI